MGYFSNGTDEFRPPNGLYTVVIQDASAWLKQSDGTEIAKATLEVVEGEHRGQTFPHMFYVGSEGGRRFAKEALAMYGLDLSDIENFGDLQAAILELIGTKAEVSTVLRGDYPPNVTVVRTITGESDVTKPADQQSFAQAASTNSAGDDDGDIPF